MHRQWIAVREIPLPASGMLENDRPVGTEAGVNYGMPIRMYRVEKVDLSEALRVRSKERIHKSLRPGTRLSALELDALLELGIGNTQ